MNKLELVKAYMDTFHVDVKVAKKHVEEVGEDAAINEIMKAASHKNNSAQTQPEKHDLASVETTSDETGEEETDDKDMNEDRPKEDTPRRPDSIFKVHGGFGNYYSWGCFFLVFLIIFGDAVGAIHLYQSIQGVDEFGVENAGAVGHFIYALEIVPDWAATLMTEGGLLLCFSVIYSKLKKCYKPMSGLAVTLVVLQAGLLLMSLIGEDLLSLIANIAMLIVLAVFGANLIKNYDGPLKALGIWSIVYLAVQIVTLIYVATCISSGDISLIFVIVLLTASLACYDQFVKAVE